MVITKSELKILKFVYSKKSVSFRTLRKKFRKCINLKDTLESLVYHHYLLQVGGCRNHYGDPIPIVDETLFTMESLGSAEVESKQWFNGQFVLTQILLPIVIAIITTLLTLFLSASL